MPTEQATLELLTETTAALRDIAEFRDRFESATKRMQAALDRIDAGESVEDLDKIQREATEAGEAVVKAARRAGDALERLEGDTDRTGDEFDDLRRRLDRAGKEAAELKRRYAALGTEGQRTAAKTKAAAASMRASWASVRTGVLAVVTAVATLGAGRLFRLVLDATQRQERASSLLTARLDEQGKIAGQTKDELLEYAAALQQVTRFGDEATIEAQALLSTFTSINDKDIFRRTIESSANLAEIIARGEGGTPSLKDAVLQLGKALNAPVQNLGALSKAGIQFSDAQKEQIKALVESNRLYDAQVLILGELDRQFGGVARAAALGFGSLDQFKNAVGDLLEQIGKGDLGREIIGIAAGLKALSESEDGVRVARDLSTVLAVLLSTTSDAGSLEGLAKLSSFVRDLVVSLTLLRTVGVEGLRTFTGALGALGAARNPLVSFSDAFDAAVERLAEGNRRVAELMDEFSQRLDGSFAGAGEAVEKFVPKLPALGAASEDAGGSVGGLADEVDRLLAASEAGAAKLTELKDAANAVADGTDAAPAVDGLRRSVSDLEAEAEKLEKIQLVRPLEVDELNRLNDVSEELVKTRRSLVLAEREHADSSGAVLFAAREQRTEFEILQDALTRYAESLTPTAETQKRVAESISDAEIQTIRLSDGTEVLTNLTKEQVEATRGLSDEYVEGAVRLKELADGTKVYTNLTDAQLSKTLRLKEETVAAATAIKEAWAEVNVELRETPGILEQILAGIQRLIPDTGPDSGGGGGGGF